MTDPSFQTALEMVRGAAPDPKSVPDDVAIAVRAGAGIVTPEEVEVIKATICSKLSLNQLRLFLAICRRRGVDPFTETYAFPNADGGIAFGLRIDGMRALALRTGELLSRKVETITDPKDAARIVGARATVERKGMTAPVVEEAYLAEYQKKGIGWDQYPETMIRKVAEAKALRAAFADALGGVYEPSEVRDE